MPEPIAGSNRPNREQAHNAYLARPLEDGPDLLEHASILLDQVRKDRRWHQLHGDCSGRVRRAELALSKARSELAVLYGYVEHLRDHLQERGYKPTAYDALHSWPVAEK